MLPMSSAIPYNDDQSSRGAAQHTRLVLYNAENMHPPEMTRSIEHVCGTLIICWSLYTLNDRNPSSSFNRCDPELCHGYCTAAAPECGVSAAS